MSFIPISSVVSGQEIRIILPALLKELKRVNPGKFEETVSGDFPLIPKHDWEDQWWYSDEAEKTLFKVVDKLNEFATERGYFFNIYPNNGGFSYGYWKNESHG